MYSILLFNLIIVSQCRSMSVLGLTVLVNLLVWVEYKHQQHAIATATENYIKATGQKMLSEVKKQTTKIIKKTSS